MRNVYMDHAATTPVDSRVVEAMLPYFSEKYGNPSSLYTLAQESKKAIDESREKVANLINAVPDEVIFTSGGTESDNLALKGIAFANKKKGNHIITSSIEHHAVLNPCEWLEGQGFEVTHLSVDKYGFISLEELERAIRKDTILISIMHANNEIGTIEPIEEIGKVASEREIYFHTDAVQSVGKIPVEVREMNIDLLSISSHKIYGPKGVGALYIREGVKIDPLLHGGGHESWLRSGTENIPGIVGFSKAVEIAKKEMKSERARLTSFRDKLIKGLLGIEDSRLNGHPEKRLPNNANFCFKFIDGESLVLGLEDKGIQASTGSACSSKSLESSHVLTAIGLPPVEARGSLRLTLGRYNKDEDMGYVVKTVPAVVERLRKISPLAGKGSN